MSVGNQTEVQIVQWSECIFWRFGRRVKLSWFPFEALPFCPSPLWEGQNGRASLPECQISDSPGGWPRCLRMLYGTDLEGPRAFRWPCPSALRPPTCLAGPHFHIVDRRPLVMQRLGTSRIHIEYHNSGGRKPHHVWKNVKLIAWKVFITSNT